MKQDMIDFLERHDFKYCESNYWNNSQYDDIARELVRFRWGNPKYKEHFKVYHKIHYFDDFIMTEIRHKIEDYKNMLERGASHE